MTDRRQFRLHPIDQVDVHEAVRERISELVREGGYQAGDRLPSERQLAESLRVSRVVVREALKVLEALGMVAIRQGSGTYVVDPSRDPVAAALVAGATIDLAFIRHLIDVRAALDVKAAELAAERATASDLTRLRAVLRELDAEHAHEPAAASLSLVFESLLAQIAGNPLLAANQRAVHQIWVRAWSAVGLAPGPKQAFNAEHRAIFEAVAAHDVAAAGRLMAAHVGRDLADAGPVSIPARSAEAEA
jgi:GntR family transcriptional repressor for pyruvate dehydrogenase complex